MTEFKNHFTIIILCLDTISSNIMNRGNYTTILTRIRDLKTLPHSSCAWSCSGTFSICLVKNFINLSHFF